ncbi:hypothetical protein CYMTET_44486 [Cymbomonas tetramitiformis]|uniref:Enoyl reductase (ER) domain-containing protein n=1 Tax=Cymbomonas tetramitiformis TaxID=36881 RepID=A0AAE0C041_9CHLO|nr:hypothetical protein CYMTET_44486 [Cymbomonas tetramitiformis]
MGWTLVTRIACWWNGLDPRHAHRLLVEWAGASSFMTQAMASKWHGLEVAGPRSGTAGLEAAAADWLQPVGLQVGQPKAGETVVVSAAAGATGSIVAQIAKHVIGCRVVGIAGGAPKCRWLSEELGLDATIDYKQKGLSLRKQLKAACPKGIDVFFDNVGGEQLDAALACLAPRGARIVICGAISRYNESGVLPSGPTHYMNLLVNRAKMEGFVVFDYAKEYPAAIQDIAAWMGEGKVKMKEDIVHGGLEAAPAALLRLFSGANTGKLVVELVPGAHDGSHAALRSKL